MCFFNVAHMIVDCFILCLLFSRELWGGTTPSGAYRSLPPIGHSASSQSFDLPEHLSSDKMDYTVIEPKVGQDQLVTIAYT